MARVLSCLEPAERGAAVAAAVRAAKNGRLVAMPAETGYVLATDAFSATGVAALLTAKSISPGISLGVLVGHVSGVHGIAARIPGAALDLMAACWPGPLGLVVRTQASLNWTVPTDRCVVRMPLHPVLLAVVAGVGPMVYSGLATAEDRALASLVLDGGDRPTGLGSTVVDVTRTPPVLLREGAVQIDRIREVIGELVVPG